MAAEHDEYREVSAAEYSGGLWDRRYDPTQARYISSEDETLTR